MRGSCVAAVPARRLIPALRRCLDMCHSPGGVLHARYYAEAPCVTFNRSAMFEHAMPTKPSFRDPRLSRMAAFLGVIGIEMRPGVIDVPTLFPGSLISRGTLVIDESLLFAPGDALHEAAHVALAPPERRSSDSGFLKAADKGEELATIAWSWAALLELDLAPEDVFHGKAYKRGDSAVIIDCARHGIYIGFPLLQAWEMAFDERSASLRGVKPFPHMVKWLRE
jgi:hypothetical protein